MFNQLISQSTFPSSSYERTMLKSHSLIFFYFHDSYTAAWKKNTRRSLELEVLKDQFDCGSVPISSTAWKLLSVFTVTPTQGNSTQSGASGQCFKIL